MKGTLLLQVEHLTNLMRSGLVGVGIVVLLCAGIIPALHGKFVPVPYATATVVETAPDSSSVVRLKDGDHVAVTSLEAEAGDEVQVYKSEWDSYTGSPSLVGAYVVPSVFGAFGAGLLGTILCAVGDEALRNLGRRARNRRTALAGA